MWEAARVLWENTHGMTDRDVHDRLVELYPDEAPKNHSSVARRRQKEKWQRKTPLDATENATENATDATSSNKSSSSRSKKQKKPVIIATKPMITHRKILMILSKTIKKAKVQQAMMIATKIATQDWFYGLNPKSAYIEKLKS